jgi:WD40 repeat protein
MQSQRPTAKHTFEGHKNVISSFVFLHDNVHIVSGSEDGTMRKWDCDTGLPVGKPWKGKGGKILALALSPDGKTIACGRGDGSVVQRDTDGKTIRSIWRSGHGNPVQLVSWSPSGDHIASVSHGTILIRNADSDRGDVNVSPIETKHWGWVYSLSYSPSGDRVASGGNTTICIWDSNTGELLVGPMEDMGHEVMSAVWSPDGSKLYSASDQFVRVFDSTSGELLHRFEHSNWLLSVALSLQHNILACVGLDGVAQLWDTESYQPLGDPFSQENDGTSVRCVSFSRDGRYLAYGGYDKKITLWMVEDITPQLPVRVPVSESQGVSQQENQPESPSSPCLDVSIFPIHFSPCLQDHHRSMLQSLSRDLELMTSYRRVLRIHVITMTFSG